MIRNIVLLFTLIISASTFSKNKNDILPSHNSMITSADSSIISVLENCLVPNAVITDDKSILCTATHWIDQYPLIAEKLDSNGKNLWNGVLLCVPENNLDTPVFRNAAP